MRIYNPALGKFLSVDPLAKSFAWNSPYAFAENDVIRCVDLDGEEKSFRWIYEDKSGTQIHEVTWNTVFPGQENGPKGTGTVDRYYNPETQKFGEGQYVESYEDAHPVRSFFQSADNKYEGKKGFKKLGKDLSSSSTYVKAAGVITVVAGAVTGQPEIVAGGIELYNVGDKIGDVGDAAQVISKVDEGKTIDAAIILTGNVAGKVVGKGVENSGVGNEVQKFTGSVLGGEAVDNAKDKALEASEVKQE